jgi:2,3,4,5-tetrahydropyridine-2-carboxylate N-succinyltransferase
MDAENKASKVVKAKDISGESNLLFMRDSVSGKVIAKENQRKSSLNKELHKND